MSRPHPSRARTIGLVVVLLAAVAFVGWKAAALFEDPAVLPPDDFVDYYAASQVNAGGQNPYDGDLLLPIERAAGSDTDEPIMMWNPPWALPLAMPVGLLNARVAQLLWLAVSLALIVWCANRLWIEYGGPTDRRWLSWLLALTFSPSLFVLQAGQIGPFIFHGVARFWSACGKAATPSPGPRTSWRRSSHIWFTCTGLPSPYGPRAARGRAVVFSSSADS